MKFAALKASARTSLNGRWTGAVLISLCYMIIAYGMTTLLLLVSRSDSARAAASAYGIAVILTLLINVFGAGLMYYFLKLSRDDDTLSVGDLIAGFRSQPDRFLISCFLILLPVFLLPLPFTVLHLSRAGAVIWCVICGIWALYFRLTFFMTNLILFDDPQTGALTAMKKSRQLMRGHMFRLLVFFLSFIGWYVLIILSVGIAALWILPYLCESLCCFYRKLIREI